MQFPDREQRNHADIFPGLTFYFVRNPSAGDRPAFIDPDLEWWDSDCAWTVIGKEYVQKLSGGY